MKKDIKLAAIGSIWEEWREQDKQFRSLLGLDKKRNPMFEMAMKRSLFNNDVFGQVQKQPIKPLHYEKEKFNQPIQPTQPEKIKENITGNHKRQRETILEEITILGLDTMNLVYGEQTKIMRSWRKKYNQSKSVFMKRWQELKKLKLVYNHHKTRK